MKKNNSTISFIAGMAPWLAPAIPAYFAVNNAQRYLLVGSELDIYFVWIVGLAVELVGLSAVHTTLEFWQWNAEEQDHAPVWLAAAAAIFYVVTVLTVNAMLELWTGINIRVFAKAMLSTLSLPAALIIGLRAMHNQRIIATNERRAEREQQKNEQREQRRAERQAERERLTNEHRTPQPERRPKNERPVRTPSARTIPQPSNEQGGEGNEHPLGFPTNEQAAGERVVQYIEHVRRTENRTPGQSEIARMAQVSKSTADTWLKRNL